MLLNVAINVSQVATARSLQLRELNLDIFSKILYLGLMTQLRVSKQVSGYIEEEWAKICLSFHATFVESNNY